MLSAAIGGSEAHTVADVHVRLLCSCYLDQEIAHARRCCALLAIKQESYASLLCSM